MWSMLGNVDNKDGRQLLDSGPGNNWIVHGDEQQGYFGMVAARDFLHRPEMIGLLPDNIGTLAGDAELIWVKAAYKGKYLFWPRGGMKTSVTWDILYAAGLLYGRQNGDWALINTEAKKSTDLGNTPVIDPNKGVFYKLDNTMPDAKTITLKSGPGMVYPYEDYAITVALLVNGIAGELIFKTENGAVLYWHKGVQPILYAQRTTIILLWTGDEWMGSTGAQIP